MRVVSMILCEAANVMPDGRFNVLGGGIQRILCSRFPAFVRVALIIQILAERSELGGPPRELSIRLIDDDGHDVMPRLNSEIRFGPPRRDANVLLDMNNLRLPQPGHYTFTVLISGEERATWSVEAVEAQPPKPAEPPP